MNRRNFFKSVVIGAGIAPDVLNAKVKSQTVRYKYMRYGWYLIFREGKQYTKEAKAKLIIWINKVFKYWDIRKKDAISMKFIEKKFVHNDCFNRGNVTIGWIVVMREKI